MLRNAFALLSTEAKQDLILTSLGNILTELNAKLEAGQSVALDAGTLAALESVTASVSNFPSDFPDAAVLAKAEAIRALLAGTLAVSASSLPLPAGAATEAKLEAVRALLAGTLGISASSLPLPAGAATDAKLDTILTALISSAGGIFAEDTPHTSGDLGRLILAIRHDSDTPTAGDGDYTPLKLDEAGRLKVASQPASYPLATGAITANAQTVPLAVGRASNVMIHMVAASLVGHNVTFEGSIDSTNGTDGAWFAIQVVRTNANTIELTSGVLAATPAYGWEASVNGLSYIRVRATAHTSGTATWKFLPGTYATEPIPAAQVSGTQPVSGSVTATLAAATVRAGFVAAPGIWFDDSSTVLAAAASFTGTSRDLTVTATATAMANAATYAKEFRVSAESDQTGTLWLEVSRDGTNWRRAKSAPTAAIAGGGQYAEIVHRPSWRYARVGFTNGATLQTRFTIGSFAMAN
jgi:hypothetical protein